MVEWAKSFFTDQEQLHIVEETHRAIQGMLKVPEPMGKLGELVCLVSLFLHVVSVFLFRSLGCFSQWALKPFPWSSRVAFLTALLGSILLLLGYDGDIYYGEYAEFQAVHFKAIEDLNLYASFHQWRMLAIGAGALLVLGTLLSSLRMGISLWVLKGGVAGFLLTWAWLLTEIFGVPNQLWLNDEKTFDKYMRGDLWVQGFWWWMAVLAIGLLLALVVSLRSVKVFYGAPKSIRDLAGDRVAKSIQTGGKDPKYRSSTYWAWFIHIFILFLYPMLMRGCTLAPYKIPKGSGNPVVQMVKVKKVKKKPKEQIVFNPNSAISYWKPDIDDSKIMEEVEEETKDTYEASSLKSGKLGKGGGKKGGWPNGMDKARVRFIRFKYAGGDWDQQMGNGADYNFLIEFKKMTGFKIAERTESITFQDVKRFPKHRAPPFVYITGQGGISASSSDIKALRWYLKEEGGMIFADNGGGSFDRSFRSLMRRVLPDKNWIDIANDDIIYQQPFVFPNGAPPLWHHSGYRAAGIKHNGRWAVFYHQGDINDAWQSGSSGVTENVRKQAFQMGVNVVNYAFTNYLELHFGE